MKIYDRLKNLTTERKDMTAEFIKQVLELSGLSKTDFVKKARITRPTLDRWLKGQSEPSFYFQKIIRSVFREEVNKIEK